MENYIYLQNIIVPLLGQFLAHTFKYVIVFICIQNECVIYGFYV